MAVQIINVETGKTKLAEFVLCGGFAAYADNIMNPCGLAVHFTKLFCALHIKLAADEGLFHACIFQTADGFGEERRARAQRLAGV